MNVFSAMEILASGLDVQRTRLNLTSSNLANAQTTRTPEGGPYRRKDAVISTEPVYNKFKEMFDDLVAREVNGVKTDQIIEDQGPPRMVYDPTHPDADANGFVGYPNVSVVEEMVNMIMASRAYDAGVTALQTISTVARSALRVGGGN
ncbi:MAG: flagellar basal body rod protein FlgC [Myxococcota bacterium]|jgi:flagellar basal-body rod protein FlgC|nr:flagellar basal body rod protein FlgC [Myxococcota bacterium]